MSAELMATGALTVVLSHSGALTISDTSKSDSPCAELEICGLRGTAITRGVEEDVEPEQVGCQVHLYQTPAR